MGLQLIGMGVFHVTKAENAKRIWNHGICERPPDEHWVQERREMRQVLDTVGHEMYDGWVPREGAVFFWPTYEAALRYAERLLQPAVVEVHLNSPNAWAMPNSQLETFFTNFMNYGDQHGEDEVRSYAAQVVETARPWNGEYDDDLEVWLQPPVAADAIHSITDTAGNPLDFDQI